MTASQLRFEIDAVAATLRTCKLKDTPLEGIGTIVGGSPQFRIHGPELDLLDNRGEVRARFIAASAK